LDSLWFWAPGSRLRNGLLAQAGRAAWTTHLRFDFARNLYAEMFERGAPPGVNGMVRRTALPPDDALSCWRPSRWLGWVGPVLILARASGTPISRLSSSHGCRAKRRHDQGLEMRLKISVRIALAFGSGSGDCVSRSREPDRSLACCPRAGWILLLLVPLNYCLILDGPGLANRSF